MIDKKERIYFYDNLKYILITLVVIGHFLLLIPDVNGAKGLILFIYSFHMPLFVFVSGFFAKKIKDENGNFRLDRVINLLLIYIIFKFLFYFLAKVIFQQDVAVSMVAEIDAPWYLMAMALWFVLTYLFERINPKYLFGMSIVVALLAGFDLRVSDVLCLSRVFVFYPFYLAGYYLSKERMDQLSETLHQRKWQMISIIGCTLLLLLFLIFEKELYFMKPVFTGQNPYATLEFPLDIPLMGLITRVIMYVIATVLSIAVIAIIPRRKLIFTPLGSRTIQIYVLHYLIYSIVLYSGLNAQLLSQFGEMTIVIYIIFSIILTMVLSWKYLGYPFSKIMNIKYDKLYQK